MRTVMLLMTLGVAAIAGSPPQSDRIMGGITTVIEQYPFSAALLRLESANNFRLRCGGSILNTRAVLTAAHCIADEPTTSWRIRVGSTTAHSGGSLHLVNRFTIHPNYVPETLDSDIGIILSSTPFVYSNSVRPGAIAGTNYEVPDNQVVWAIGWGAIGWTGGPSEQLRQVQIWTVNQNTCRLRYSEVSRTITDNMLCSGWLDVGGRDQCQGDSGSPLLHGHVIIGVCSWGEVCGHSRYPGVNARVNRFTSWILSNA